MNGYYNNSRLSTLSAPGSFYANNDEEVSTLLIVLHMNGNKIKAHIEFATITYCRVSRLQCKLTCFTNY